jgi:8-oxo-dGTP diphosphatase
MKCYNRCMFKKMDPIEIRKHKGKSFVGVATAVAIFNQQGQLLLARRSENCRDEHGKWDICGGGLKAGNTIDTNLRSEMKEELDIDSEQILHQVGVHEAFRIDQNNDSTHWLSLDHVIILTEEDVKRVKINEPENFTDIGWFNLDKLPTPLHSQLNEQRLKKIKLKLGEIKI